MNKQNVFDSITTIEDIDSGRYSPEQGDVERNIQFIEFFLAAEDNGLSESETNDCLAAIEKANNFLRRTK